MTAEQVIALIGVLIGLFFTVGRPIIKLNNNIVKLNINLENIQKQQDKYEHDNATEHDRIWKHLRGSDKTVAGHSMRLHDIDGKIDEI